VLGALSFRALLLVQLRVLLAEHPAAMKEKRGQNGRHGPIALITPETPTVLVAPTDKIYEKTLSNIEGVKARKA
jgi:hypothetical protein